MHIAGSLTACALATRYRMKSRLALMHASRAVIVAVCVRAPKAVVA